MMVTNVKNTRDGIGISLHKTAKKNLLEWHPVSERIITACFSTKI
jgi:hypothetical protein